VPKKKNSKEDKGAAEVEEEQEETGDSGVSTRGKKRAADAEAEGAGKKGKKVRK